MNNNSKILWPPGRNDENILLMLIDAFPYMVKTSDYLKVFYINTIRVTCTDHTLNRIAKKVVGREMHSAVNELSINLKKSFESSRSILKCIKTFYQCAIKPCSSAPVLLT
jgi:hypothetical protein